MELLIDPPAHSFGAILWRLTKEKKKGRKEGRKKKRREETGKETRRPLSWLLRGQAVSFRLARMGL